MSKEGAILSSSPTKGASMAALLCVGGGGLGLEVEYRRHCGLACATCERTPTRGTGGLSLVAHLETLLANIMQIGTARMLPQRESQSNNALEDEARTGVYPQGAVKHSLIGSLQIRDAVGVVHSAGLRHDAALPASTPHLEFDFGSSTTTLHCGPSGHLQPCRTSPAH